MEGEYLQSQLLFNDIPTWQATCEDIQVGQVFMIGFADDYEITMQPRPKNNTEWLAAVFLGFDKDIKDGVDCGFFLLLTREFENMRAVQPMKLLHLDELCICFCRKT